MASRIFWVALAGIALVTGMMLQDRDWLFGWNDHTDISATTERAIEAGVERAVEGGFDDMQVVGPDGRQVDVAPEAKRALGDAVGQLVKAETELAVLRIEDASAQEIQAAKVVRDHAREDVDRLKAQIERQGQAAVVERDAVREQIRREIREDIRETVRDAVRN